jgi:GNAT superfamily N-acetyltransferase
MDAKQTLQIINPSSSSECAARDELLKISLREQDLTWNYSQEYPLVLNPANTESSWCAYENGNLLAHANLWPRNFTHISTNRTFRLGLVGNVATHPDHRSKGHMATLMTHLATIAEQQNLNALVLWSDLLEFYQILGFRSIGREYRMTIQREDRARHTGIVKIDPSRISDEDLELMLALRPKMEWNLKRSPQEFRALLNIPEAHLFVRRRGTKIQSWMIIGKGMDMNGVIHEWGASKVDEFLSDIQSLMHDYNIPELILLTPAALHSHWLAPLKMRASAVSEHPMALAKPLGTAGLEAFNALSKGFIWGLDSI